jgi:hypothetical protein
MKITMAIASAVLLGGVLTACGGSDDGGGPGATGGGGSDYCKDIKGAAATFSDFGTSESSSISDAFATFHKLADEAPGAIKDDWKTLEGAITTIEDALESAGIKLEDFEKLQSGQVPEGVDVTKLQGLATEFQKLSGAEFEKASKAIEKHAKDVCEVDLS